MQISIKAKLNLIILPLVALSLLFLAAAFWAYIEMQESQRSLRRVISHSVAVGRFAENYYAQCTGYVDYLLTGDQKARENVRQSEQRGKKLLQEWKDKMSAGSGNVASADKGGDWFGEREAVDRFEQDYLQICKQGELLISLIERGDLQKARGVMAGELMPLVHSAGEHLDEYIAEEEKKLGDCLRMLERISGYSGLLVSDDVLSNLRETELDAGMMFRTGDFTRNFYRLYHDQLASFSVDAAQALVWQRQNVRQKFRQWNRQWVKFGHPEAESNANPELVGQIEGAYESAERLAGSYQQMVDRGEIGRSAQLYQWQLRPEMRKFTELAGQFLAYQFRELAEDGEHGQTHSLLMMGLVGGFGVLVLVCGFGTPVLLHRAIIRPLKGIQEGVRRFGEGDAEVRIDVSHADELGDLASAFNRMALSIATTTVSKDYLDNIIDSMSESLVVVSQSGEIHSINRAGCELLGYSAEELVGRRIELILWEDQEGDGWEKLVQSSTPTSMHDLNRQFVTRDGAHIPILLSVSHLENSRSFVCLAHDMTELNEAQQAILESEIRYQAIFETTSAAMLIIEEDTIISLVNEEFAKLWGYPRSEIEGVKSWQEFAAPEDLQRMLDYHRLRRTNPSEAPKSYEFRFVNRQGKVLEVSANFAIIPGSGRSVGSLVDVTGQKDSEKELRKSAAKLESSNRELQDFAYVASHDLQEPLRKIQTFGDRLQAKCAEALGEEGADYLARMRNAAGRMQTLINDLLAFSRVTTKAQPFAPVDLNEVAHEVLTDLETRIESTGGTVEVGLLPVMDADPLQMRQLLQNLIGNALKFHRPETPPMVKVWGEEIPGGFWRVCVRDNGIGFEDKYRERIFAPFQRLHGRSEYEGTGIGLTICKKIAERHGGDIATESMAGEGATFIVTLPVRQMELAA